MEAGASAQNGVAVDIDPELLLLPSRGGGNGVANGASLPPAAVTFNTSLPALRQPLLRASSDGSPTAGGASPSKSPRAPSKEKDSLKRVCPKPFCGNILMQDSKFCRRCGTQVDDPRSLDSDHHLDARLSVSSHRWLARAKSAAEWGEDNPEMHEILSNKKVEGPQKYWNLLILTAFLSATLSFGVDQAIAMIGNFRSKIVADAEEQLGQHPIMIAVAFNVCIVTVARLIVRTTVQAEGSGIPEVKTMLFGKNLDEYLTFRVLCVKALTLSMVVGAGLPIGKEGPFVHLSACIMANIHPIFGAPGGGAVKYLLLAACAVGVGTTFSSPLGGVIFALELMLPQVYDLTAYWGCFSASVLGAITYAAWKTWTGGATGLLPLMSTDVLPGEGVTTQYPLSLLGLDVLLGCVCGLLGGLFIKMHQFFARSFKAFRLAAKSGVAPVMPEITNSSKKRAARDAVSWNQPLLHQKHLHPRKSAWATSDLSEDVHNAQIRRQSKTSNPFNRCFRWVWSLPARCSSSWEWRDLFIVITACVLNTLLAGYTPLLADKPQPLLLSTLFSKQLAVSNEWWMPGCGAGMSYFLAFLVKWVMTGICLALPTPTGMVAPTMIIGGLIGRCFYHALPETLSHALMAPSEGGLVSTDIIGAFAARFAIVGGAAFCSAVSRAFAMAITVFEVLALPNTVLPLSCASLAAIFVANEICPSFFDSILLFKGLSGVPALTSTRRAMLPVARVMRRLDVHSECLTHRTTLNDVQKVLEKCKEDTMFPIVHRLSGGLDALLVGDMLRTNLEEFLASRKSWSGDTVIDLLDPAQWHQASAKHETVNRMPLHVPPKTPVKDVYLLLRVMYTADAVYVTSQGRLLGVVTAEDLLGKD